MSTIATTSEAKSQITIGNRGIELRDFESLWRFSSAVAKSGLAPKSIPSAEGIFVAIQMGLEVGLTPMAALQNIAVINGRPSIWGDAQLGIVRATGELEEFTEWYEQGGRKLPRNPVTFTDDTVAVCRIKRRGYESSEVGFSVGDAKTAKLWGKEGPWSQYPARMLRNRARSFCLRDGFGDALKGLRTDEEVRDMPIVNVTPTIDDFVGKLPEPPQKTASTRKPKQQAQPEELIPKEDPYAVLVRVLGDTPIADLVEGLIADGEINGIGQPQADSIKAVTDLPRDIAEKYAANNGEQLSTLIKYVQDSRK